MTSLAICKPIDKGVTPNNSKSCTCEDPSSVRPRHTDALIVNRAPVPRCKGWSTMSLATRMNQVPSFTIVFFVLLPLLLLHVAFCCCCICVLRQVQHQVQRAFSALSACLSVCLSVCLFSHFASSARHRISSTLSPSRACSAALLAARQTRRRPLALRMLDPSSIRIHHAFLNHVMCLFDTSLSSQIWFLLSPSLFSSISCLNFTLLLSSLLLSIHFSLTPPELWCL